MPSGGVLRVVSNSELDEMEREALEVQNVADEDSDAYEEEAIDRLAAYVRKEYQRFKWHRDKFQLGDRFLENIRQYNGNYSAAQIAEIKKFGGSEVFAQMTAVKCRGATALLRDVFLGSEKPWALTPTPDPELPDDISGQIQQLVGVEMQTMQSAGEQIDPKMLQERVKQLYDAAKQAAAKTAKMEAEKAEKKLNDTLTEGGFYEALMEFLTDLAIFPFACMKGPEVRRKIQLDWVDGELTIANKPQMFWRRVSPFDIYYTPGAEKIADADVIEKIRLQRKELNTLIGLPGYREDAIRAVLNDYEYGKTEWLDSADTQRANEESRENPHQNDSNMIDGLEYHGAVKGSWLEEYGFDDIEDPDMDYHVVCWVIGIHVIKVQMNPNPKQRHPYYTSSFEKIPGSIPGNALPEILRDVQDMANASFRSLANNMSISSGPQVMINEERLAPNTNSDSLYPWKRWRYLSDPLMSDTAQPVTFFQPDSNANELLGVYKAMMDMADDVSAIPRYVTGSGAMGGAASTASGLSMLMNNASKVLQNVAAAIDADIIGPMVEDLYVVTMVTDDTGMLRGDEQIVVKGVAVATAKETDRMRQMEMLQMTANPIDMEIIGTDGRAALLRAAMEGVGLPEERIVPSELEMRKHVEAQQKQGQIQQQAAAAQGNQPARPGGQERQAEEFDNMHRTNT